MSCGPPRRLGGCRWPPITRTFSSGCTQLSDAERLAGGASPPGGADAAQLGLQRPPEKQRPAAVLCRRGERDEPVEDGPDIVRAARQLFNRGPLRGQRWQLRGRYARKQLQKGSWKPPEPCRLEVAPSMTGQLG